MERLIGLKDRLNQLDLINYQIVKSDGQGLEIHVRPNRSIYLKYQSHQIQIDPPETYCLLVCPGAEMVQLKRLDSSSENAIDLPNQQLKSEWTDLLFDLLSIMKLLRKKSHQSQLNDLVSAFDLEMTTLMGSDTQLNNYHSYLDSGCFEVAVDAVDGEYYFSWDEMGNLHEEGRNSGVWNYFNLEFLKTAKSIDLYQRTSKLVFNGNDSSESEDN